MLTWRAYPDTASQHASPLWAEITPPDDCAHLKARWPSEPVRGGDITTWPLRAAPPGQVPTGTGTVEEPFNGMCVAAAGNGSANGTQLQMAVYRGDETMQPWHVSFYHYMDP